MENGEMKHTDEIEWKAVPYIYPNQVFAGGEIIAERNLGMPLEEGCANLKLIAAAPDMLDALLSIIAEHEPGTLDAELREVVYSAIEKATGDKIS